MAVRLPLGRGQTLRADPNHLPVMYGRPPVGKGYLEGVLTGVFEGGHVYGLLIIRPVDAADAWPLALMKFAGPNLQGERRGSVDRGMTTTSSDFAFGLARVGFGGVNAHATN